MVIEKPKGRIAVFASGGAGTNIARQMEAFRKVDEEGVAKLSIGYIDTSRSNLSKDIPEDSIYLIDGLDGSGKIRRENHEEIAARTRDILQRFQPQDLNIVVHSAAGGSGSVIGPSLVSELLDRGVPVIVFAVGDTSTRVDIDNTMKTIKSYESIAGLRKAPVVMSYHQNSKTTPRHAVDTEVLEIINTLCVLFSRQNQELDSKDLYNFLRYERVAQHISPALASLKLWLGEAPQEKAENVVTVASLAAVGGDTSLPFTPEYQCVGFLPDAASSDRIKELVPLHFTVSTGLFGSIVKEMNAKLDELGQAGRARVADKIVTDSDRNNTTDSGLVL